MIRKRRRDPPSDRSILSIRIDGAEAATPIRTPRIQSAEAATPIRIARIASAASALRPLLVTL